MTEAGAGGQQIRIYGLPVQFCCEPKLFQKNEIYFLNKGLLQPHPPPQCVLGLHIEPLREGQFLKVDNF